MNNIVGWLLITPFIIFFWVLVTLFVVWAVATIGRWTKGKK